MSELPYSFTERPRPQSYWALCGQKDTGHTTVILYEDRGGTYFFFLGLESSWLVNSKSEDKWKPTDLPVHTNPLVSNSFCSHVVTRHCERTKNSASGAKGTLSEGYTVQLPTSSSSWGFPKGGAIRSETPSETAEREVWEETDFRLDSARLKDTKQTPTFSYSKGKITGTGFLYELTPSESRNLMCSYALLNLRREGELFFGRMVSIHELHHVYYPTMNHISKMAFDEFCRQKGINKLTLGGGRHKKTRRNR